MQERNTTTLDFPSEEAKDVLTEILREGAQTLLVQAIEFEVDQWIDRHANLKDESGHRQIVRNGRLPKRRITTGVGQVEIEQPRVHDRRGPESAEKFTSKILPPYLRKTKSIEELIPWLYLKGISTSDFGEALQSILGRDVPGLSASTITRLKSIWEKDYRDWSKRSLQGEQYAYVWADGVHFNVRLEEDRQCILVLMGATADGKKELIAVMDGYRERAQSWKELLLDVKSRGLDVDPKLATGDGALGFWKALSEVWPATREQRCWVHKTANVLDKLPKRLQPGAKEKLHEIWMAETRDAANQAFDLFLKTYQAKYPQGLRVPEAGPGRAVNVLRLPGGTLDSFANHQPDRIDVRHREASSTQDEGQRFAAGLPDDGLQADGVGLEEVAAVERIGDHSRRHSRHPIHRRNPKRPSRRLKKPHPQLIAISRFGATQIFGSERSRS